MMEPFADMYEVITFISMFFIAVVGIPYAFSKIGEWLGYRNRNTKTTNSRTNRTNIQFIQTNRRIK